MMWLRFLPLKALFRTAADGLIFLRKLDLGFHVNCLPYFLGKIYIYFFCMLCDITLNDALRVKCCQFVIDINMQLIKCMKICISRLWIYIIVLQVLSNEKCVAY